MVAIAPSSLARVGRRALAFGLAAVVACAVTVGGLPSVAAADQIRGDQWQLAALDVRDAWKLSTGKGVVVAVIDSGVDAKHPDLAGQVLPGIDLVNPQEADGGEADPVGHGTTVAGLIAGSDSDSTGVVGIAPGVKILPVRVLDKDNKYDDPGVVATGVRWAVDHGASVINLSLGGATRSEAIAASLRYAAAHDVVVVACTGNIATDPSIHEVWYPAREPGVIAVAGLSTATVVTRSASPAPSRSGSGGTGGSDALWSGSLTGPETVLTAPAVNLTGAKPGGGYWQVQGTSFAAPLVAGAASLVRARYPEMSAANVINRLIGTAKDLGPQGRDDRFGFGEVNPLAALRTPVAEVTTNPLTPALPKPWASAGRGGAPSASAVLRQGGVAPQPATSSEAPGVEQLGIGRRVGPSVTVGLFAMLLILIFGAASVLVRHRRRHNRRSTL
jgi:subtilisin family serine protease